MYEIHAFSLVWYVQHIRKMNHEKCEYMIEINARLKDGSEVLLIKTKKMSTLEQVLLEAYSQLSEYSDTMDKAISEVSKNVNSH